MRVKSSITFYFENTSTIPFPKKQTREWIVFIIHNEKRVEGVINIIFCDDETLANYNIKYLAHDTLTDIITFDYSDFTEKISGDIFISLDRVRDNAMRYGVKFETEFYRVIFHGILHLLGYDDKSSISKKQMREREDFYLNFFKIDYISNNV